MCKLCQRNYPSTTIEALYSKFAIEFSKTVKEYTGEYPCAVFIQNARNSIGTTNLSIDEYIMMKIRKIYIMQKLKKEELKCSNKSTAKDGKKAYLRMYMKYNIENKTIARYISQITNKITGAVVYHVGKLKNKKGKTFASLEDAIAYRDA